MNTRARDVVCIACVVLWVFGCTGRDRGRTPTSDAGGGDAGAVFDAAIVDDGSGSDGGGTGTDGGSDAGPSEATDTRYFVPDIPNTYDGTITEPGFEIIAHTIREDRFGDFEFLIAAENTSSMVICALAIDTTFYNSSGTPIAEAGGLVMGPPHRGVSGTGSLVSSCVGPGQIGMQSSPLYMDAGDPSDITSATWDVSGINLTDAVPTTDLTVTSITEIDDGFGSNRFTGRFNNNSGTTVTYPEVSIFGLNAVGRPLFETRDIDTGSVPPGSAWTFETSPSFTETYARLEVFPEAND